MDILAIIEGLIAAVPEATMLWNKVVGLITPAADIPDQQMAEIQALVPVAHAAVAVVNATITAPTAPPAAA